MHCGWKYCDKLFERSSLSGPALDPQSLVKYIVMLNPAWYWPLSSVYLPGTGILLWMSLVHYHYFMWLFKQFRRLILVYCYKLIISFLFFFCYSTEWRINKLTDAPDFLLGHTTVAVDLYQPSGSMEGMQSREDDLHSLHHWQMVTK